MPYLHWELDRQRNNFSDYIDKGSYKEQKLVRDEEERLWKARREERRGLHGTLPQNNELVQEPTSTQTPNRPTHLSSRSATAPGSRPLPNFMEKWLDRQPTGMLSHIKP